MTIQTRLPCVLMRGGTSKGPFFLRADLPEDDATRDAVLLAAMGSPDMLQTDGIGGATPLTSKVAMVSLSERDDADLDYLFAQVAFDKPIVDTSPNCGNMLSGVGPFGIEAGLINAQDPETTIRIYNVNTQTLIEAVIQTPGGRVQYDGDASIDGVPGTAAPVVLNFLDAAGSKCASMLPTGNAKDIIDGIEVSCVDVAMPMVLVKAEDMGKTGYESKAELDADKAFYEKLESIRQKASPLMGLGDPTGKVIPKFGIVARPKNGGSITARYFVPYTCHAAFAVTGSCCVASAAVTPGTVANDVAKIGNGDKQVIAIEHPSGKIDVNIEFEVSGDFPEVKRVGIIRTCRRLFEGHVMIPGTVWPGHRQSKTPHKAAAE
ncbi:MAG: 4-oxalomesaconate tautomerase [Rhodospirillales bacterium]